MKHVLLLAIFFSGAFTAKAQSTFEKNGISFEVIIYTRSGVDQDSRGDYPVFYVDNIDSRVSSANYNLGGKTYNLSSFNGQLRDAFDGVKVAEMRVVASLPDGSMKIDACFEPYSRHGNNISNLKKGTKPNLVHKVQSICKLSGLEELNYKIRQLEAAEKQKKVDNISSNNETEKKVNESKIKPKNDSNHETRPTAASSAKTSGNQTNTAPRVDHVAEWNNQVARDRENLNQAVDNFSNTLGQWAQNAREEKEAEQARAEEREMRRMEEQAIRQNKITSRYNVVGKFNAKDIPTGSKEKADRIYYFLYAYNNLNEEYSATAYISNVFEIGKSSDGTRPFTAKIKEEIAKLTPYSEILHGYYYSQEEAEQQLEEFKSALRNSNVIITNITYKGKPAAANKSADDFWETEKPKADTEKNKAKTDDFWNE